MTDATSDEEPKRRVARKVVAGKRKYFVPEHGVVVSGKTPDEAVAKAEKLAEAGETEDSDEEASDA